MEISTAVFVGVAQRWISKTSKGISPAVVMIVTYSAQRRSKATTKSPAMLFYLFYLVPGVIL